MHRYKTVLWAMCLGLTACGRPALNQNNLPENSATPETSTSIQESVVPITGGRATSQDGIFSIEISPHTFEQLVTVTIENLSEHATTESRSVRGVYRVRLEPESVTLPESKTVRAFFSLSEENVQEIGLENLRIVLRTNPSDDFSIQQSPRFDTDTLWSTSSIVAADFSLIRTTEPNNCACDSDDTCTSDCSCDPDCDGGVDPSDAGNPTECGPGEFACHSGDQCIPQIYFCDGLPQCNDGTDETDNACHGNTGPAQDSFEPDNTYGQASNIGLGESQTHTLPAGDGDFVTFTLAQRQDVQVLAQSSFQAPHLTLYTENHSLIATTSDGSFQPSGNLQEVLEAGVYFVYATSQDGSAINNYTLRVEASAPLSPGPENLAVHIESTTAVLIWESLSTATSYNVYYGEVPGGPYTPFSAVALEGQPPLNTDQTTFTLSGLPVQFPVFMVVRGVDAGGTETYPSNEVSVVIPLAEDLFEPDNSFQTASLLGGEPIFDGTLRQEHSSHVEADLDYIQVELTGWKNTLTVTTSGPDEWGDTELYLYNESYTQLAYNDQDEVAGNSYSRIETSDHPAGTYYVLARPWGDWATIGTYFVDVKVEVDVSPEGNPDEFEADDSIDEISGSAAHLLASTQNRTHSIHTDGDVDFSQIEIPTRANITLETSANGGSLYTRLFSAQGELLSTSRNTDTPNRLIHNDAPAGTYFVAVASALVPHFLASYELALTVFAHPEPPQNVVVTPLANALEISWESDSPSTGYIVQYTYSEEPPFETIHATEGPSPLNVQGSPFTLTGLPTLAHTYVCVRTVNGSAQSDCSTVVSGTPLPPDD